MINPIKFYFFEMKKDINLQNFLLNFYLLWPRIPGYIFGKIFIKKSKNISGISPGYPGYIFEGTDDYNQTAQTFTILGDDNLDPLTIIVSSKTIDFQEMIEGLDIEQLLIMMVEYHRKTI